MPLCELVVPGTIPQIGNETATSLCDIALNGTLRFLNIPDPNDRDFRVIVSDKTANSSLTLSLTCGTDEYEKGKKFEPAISQINALGLGVLAYAKKSEFKVSQVIIETWRNTTFMMRSPNETNTIAPPALESKDSPVKIKTKPTITLTLSPDAIKNFPLSGRESITQGLLGLTQINLNLLEKIGGEIKIQFARIAGTDISVEIDFKDIDTPLFSDEERKNLASKIMRYLDNNEGTKTGTASVWIRQGKPETYVFTPKDLE